MSEIVQELPVDLKSPSDPLADLRSARDDFSQFFGDVFDQLQMLSLEMFARHKCLEATVTSADDGTTSQVSAELKADVEQCLEELRRTHETLQAQSDNWQLTHAEVGSTRKQIGDDHAEFQAIRKQVEAMAGQFTEVKADMRQQSDAVSKLSQRVDHQLSELADAAQELIGSHARVAAEFGLPQLLDSAKEQQASWHAERAELKGELATARQEAVELADLNEQYKRAAAQQYAEMSGELKRMRSLLETLNQQFRNTPATNGTSERTRGPADGALGSVLAQVELMHRDVLSRRSGPENWRE